MAYKSKQRNFKKRETKEEFAARKKAEKEAVYDTIDDSITEMMNDDESFISYLDFQSRMDFYSASNAILIMSRCPDATLLKSADSWNELDVKINKGEKAIHILEPIEDVDKNGEQRTFYNVKNVFDISQTNAEPKPPQKAESNPKVLAVSLMETAPMQKVNAAELPIPYSTAFYDHDNNKLMVKKGSNPISVFRDVARELALAEIAQGCDEYKRKECLPSANCAAYMLCQKYGIDNSDMNVTAAKQEWAGLENKEIRSRLAMANDGLYSVGKNLYIQLQKEKEAAEKSNKEPAR